MPTVPSLILCLNFWTLILLSFPLTCCLLQALPISLNYSSLFFPGRYIEFEFISRELILKFKIKCERNPSAFLRLSFLIHQRAHITLYCKSFCPQLRTFYWLGLCLLFIYLQHPVKPLAVVSLSVNICSIRWIHMSFPWESYISTFQV